MMSGFVFPRFMTTQAYADYQTFSLYLSYITIFSLGFPTGMFVNYGGQPFVRIDKGRYKSEVCVLLSILICFAVLFGTVWLFTRSRMLLYISLCIIPYCLVCSYQSLCQAWGEFNKFSYIHVTTMAVPLLGSVLLYLVYHKLESEYYIFLFLGIYLFYMLVILCGTARATRGAVRAPYFDDANIQTWKTGFLICIGNYINVLFHSVDKQFVKLIFDTTTFAEYSFGLSLQAIPMVFITSIAQPMYHFLSSGQVAEKRYNIVMRFLLMLGACSCMIYHFCRIVVPQLVPGYTGSLGVVAVYFIAFPALMVINCLNINLYKLTRQTKQYICTLIGILLLAIVLNGLFVLCRKNTVSIAAATVTIYYFWMFLDMRRFRLLQFGARDMVFLAYFLTAYLISLQIENAILAVLGYALSLLLICVWLYRNEICKILQMVKQKRKNECPTERWK